MYSTHVGQSVRNGFNRKAAYHAAFIATKDGIRNISIFDGDELEAKVVVKSNGGVLIWTPDVTKKWECSKFFGEVAQNGLA